MTQLDGTDSGFNAQTTADEALEGIDLSGKRALVTGASSGIGLETARALAACGCEVIMTARDEKKLNRARDSVVASVSSARVSTALFDLLKQDEIRRFGADFPAAESHGLDLLINNAGVMACPLAHSAEGWESQFASNHFGHFLLTALLMPLLLKSSAPRVVNLSSAAHRYSPVFFEDIHYERRSYDKWHAYGQSKTANILFSLGLSQRFAAQGLHSNAVHPGVIATELARHLGGEESVAMWEQLKKSRGNPVKEIPAGASTTVWAATSSLLEERGGLYLENCNFSYLRSGGPDEDDRPGGYMAYAVDEEAANRLWTLSEAAFGVSL